MELKEDLFLSIIYYICLNNLKKMKYDTLFNLRRALGGQM